MHRNRQYHKAKNTMNKTWEACRNKTNPQKPPGSTGLGGHSSKPRPYKRQKLKNWISFSSFSLPGYKSLRFTWRGAGALGELSSCRMLRGERPAPPAAAMTLVVVLRFMGLLPSGRRKHVSQGEIWILITSCLL